MQDSNLTCPLSETLGYEPSEFVLYSNLRYIFGCGGGNRNHLVQAYETCKCTSSNFPAMYLVQEAGLAPAWFSYLSTNLWRGHVCLSSCLTVRTLSPLLYFFYLQYVKELCKFRLFKSVLIVSKYTVLFPLILIFFLKNFSIFLGGPAGYCPPVLLRLLTGSFTGLVAFSKETNFTIPLF